MCKIHEDDVRYLGASEFLGHMGFFESMSRRSVDCHTVEETVVAVYKYAQVMELLTKTPKFGVRLVRLLTFAQIDILRNNTKGAPRGARRCCVWVRLVPVSAAQGFWGGIQSCNCDVMRMTAAIDCACVFEQGCVWVCLLGEMRVPPSSVFLRDHS